MTPLPTASVVYPQIPEQSLAERMTVLQQLLPVPASKLPSLVLQRPLMLLRSPRALARDIQDLATALGLTSWATARLVAGGPMILGSNTEVLKAR